MASNPSFLGTPKFANIILNATNAGDASYINPTTIATILTIGSTGGRIDNVYVQPLGTNAASNVRFFVDTVGSGGANNRMVREVFLTATTSSSTSPVTQSGWSPGLVLPSASVLRATLSNTALTTGVCVSVEYGEF